MISITWKNKTSYFVNKDIMVEWLRYFIVENIHRYNRLILTVLIQVNVLIMTSQLVHITDKYLMDNNILVLISNMECIKFSLNVVIPFYNSHASHKNMKVNWYSPIYKIHIPLSLNQKYSKLINRVMRYTLLNLLSAIMLVGPFKTSWTPYIH